jgi:hypothetical protein
MMPLRIDQVTSESYYDCKAKNKASVEHWLIEYTGYEQQLFLLTCGDIKTRGIDMERRDIEEMTIERFSFLGQYGFTKRISVRHKGSTSTVVFRNAAQQLGIALSLDFSKNAILATLGRLERGEWPKRLYGPFYQPLDLLLHKLSPELAPEDPVQPNEQNHLPLEAKLASLATMLEDHFPAIMAQPYRQLFPLPVLDNDSDYRRASNHIYLSMVEQFSPLLSSKGFQPMPILEQTGIVTTFSWPKGDVGLGFSFEWRDAFFHCYLQHLQNGKVQERYWEHQWDYMKVVRSYLGESPLLIKIWQDDEARNINHCTYGEVQVMIITWHELVAQTLDKILEEVDFEQL